MSRNYPTLAQRNLPKNEAKHRHEHGSPQVPVPSQAASKLLKGQRRRGRGGAKRAQ